jgi:ethanolamine utilization protein EutN
MRIGMVKGRVVLNRSEHGLLGGRFLIVEVQSPASLAGKIGKPGDRLVVYDNLGAGEGQLIAFTESREASAPFYPEKLVPLDAYNAAILDAVVVEDEA